MARRASSRPNPVIILGVAATIVGAAFAGKSLLGRKATAFADVSPLHMEDLLENGNSLRGNEYVVQGVIEEQLQWTRDRGQLVSVRVDTPSSDEFISIKIPPEFNSINIETRQKYSFKVKFYEGGNAVATGVNRL
jgi:hypothetical protein